nr:hypothetical protein CFP56_78927 [Quercus suber]
MIGPGCGSPIEIDFPRDDNSEYDFFPCPLESASRPPHGPISVGEFRDHFYRSYYPCHTWYRYQHRRRLFGQVNTTAIESLPKRKQELEMHDGKREIFWGIYARERRCFAWMLGYVFLCNLPGLLFFFLWLFQWEHASDLQNVAVPVGLSLSLTISFVGSLLAGSQSRTKNDS